MKDTDQPQQGTAPLANAPSSPAATAAGMTAALQDRSKFIRTMAKDMAAASGTPVAPAPTPAKETEKKDDTKETFSGVTLEKAQQPFFEKQRSVAEIEAEAPLDLPPVPEVARPAPVPALAADAERAAILERLKQKVQARPTESKPAPIVTAPALPPVLETPTMPPPVASAPEPAPTPVFAPTSEPAPARIPPVGKETYREPIEEYVPQVSKPAPTNEGLHTYKSDFADRIDTQGASTFSVLAAEQDAGSEPRASQKQPVPARAILAIGSGILLLVLAGGGIFATYRFVMTMKDAPIAAVTVPSIVVADEYREIEGSGTTLMDALRDASVSVLIPGNTLVTYVVVASGEEGGTLLSGPAGGDALVRALRLPAPDILLRNIASESTVGAVNSGGQSAPFFALRVDSYERTYAGMLTWEPLMARDLATLYPLYPVEAVFEPETAIATSTMATGTPPSTAPVQATALTRFEDTVVANRDVRILRDTAGRALIVYGYADKRTLLIVRNEAAFTALIGRLKSE